MIKKEGIPEFAIRLAVKDVSTVEEFHQKYIFRPTHSEEWHKAVLETMKKDLENKGYAMISNHSSITKSLVCFIQQ